MAETEKTSAWLLGHASDTYSQTGEDGIIEKILEHIPHKDSWCVEFGAWDGRLLSNTRNLIESKDYSAVLIEGEKARFDDLRKIYAHNKKVITLNRYVGFDERDNLDRVLEKTPIPHDFDFLSIDIDGNDYYVWEALTEYKPKIVCIEFNPTIPTEVDFIQAKDPRVTQGCGLAPLSELGKRKGYELVSALQFNALFVKAEYYPLFGIKDNSPAVLRKNLYNIAYIFSGYDGRIFLQGNLELPWHGIVMKESKIQVLPKYLRMYPEKYGLIQRILFMIAFSFPRIFNKMKMIYANTKNRGIKVKRRT